MRELARQGYSSVEIAQALAESGPIDQRFDLVDRNFSVIDTLDVTAATVDWEAGRAIPRSLRLTMLPRTDLLDVPFRYLVKPYYLVGMPDGGWVEFPMGAYVFTIPERTVQENAAEGSGTSDDAGDNTAPENPETWSLTLGDQMHYLDAAGVGPSGFTVPLASRLTDGLVALLGRNNISDVTGIDPSDALASQQLAWNLRSGASGSKWVYTFVPGPGPYATTRNPYTGQWYAKYEWRFTATPLEDQATTWAKVAAELHSQLGYLAPGFDLDNDRYIARPGPDLAALSGTPVIAYAPGPDSLLTPGVQVTPALSALGNRATVTQSTSTAGVNDVAVLDLNDLIPGHPLSQGRTGFYMELAATSPGGASHLQLVAQAAQLLYKALTSYESVRFVSLASLSHDSWEIVSLRIPDDPIFDTPQLCSEANWSLDLMTGSMAHEVRRLGLPAV